jgi:Ca2+-binding RTX toxin-like protein
MRGDGGNDYYYVRDSGDVVQEFSGGGTDRVYSYLSNYTMGDHVEDAKIMSSKAASLTGNDLDNFIYAGKGNNVIDAGAGDDSVSYLYGARSGVTVSLGTNAAQATVGSGDDQLVSIENLYGSNFGDELYGNDAANILRGHSGNDTLRGSAGNDILIGDEGDDIFFGGADSDFFEGGDGQDLYIFSQGESSEITYDGVDTFTALSGLDVISDFDDGEDSIDIFSLDLIDPYMSSKAFNGTTQDQNVSIVDGNWDGSEFTISNSGDDALIIYDGDASAAANFTGIILSDIDITLLQILSSDDSLTIS